MIPKGDSQALPTGAAVSGGPPDAAAGMERPDGKRGGRGERGEKGKGKGRGSFDISQLDADKDGKLSKSEVPERMQQFFDFIDADKDGFLDKPEMEKAAKMAGGRRGGEGKDGPPGDRPSGDNGPAGGGPDGRERRGFPAGVRPGSDGQ